MNSKVSNCNKYGLVGLVLLFVALAVLGYFFYQTSRSLELTKVELSNTQSDLAQTQEMAKILEENLLAEKDKNSVFSGQITEIFGTVGNLDKLAKTDKELLQKYSKVYFLNEHYVPDVLTELPPDYLYEESRKMQVHAKVYPYLQEMLAAAKNEGVDLKIISAYRSFSEQSSLKNTYSVTYGSGANKFSADQGYSEHQLGTTVDFTTTKIGSVFNKFGSTESFDWLKANAYKYGFILSYPDGNSYYQYEPWHWRFVGKALANRLHEENENFYDLLQSQIDPYLLKLFD